MDASGLARRKAAVGLGYLQELENKAVVFHCEARTV